MIFSRVFCNVCEESTFKFLCKEVFTDVFVKKSIVKDYEVILLDSFHTSPTKFEKGVSYYNLKKELWESKKIPLILKSGDYNFSDDEIITKVEVYCLRKDFDEIKKKQA